MAKPTLDAIAKGRTPPSSSTDGGARSGAGRSGGDGNDGRSNGGGQGPGGGDPPDHGDGAPACPRCGGVGWLRHDVPVGHPDFGKAFPCDCITDELAERRLSSVRQASNIAALDHMTFDTFRLDAPGNSPEQLRTLKTACDAARSFAVNPSGWLVFHGGYGCGKTHLAAAIVNARLRAGAPAVFIGVPDLLDHLRASYGSGENDEGFESRFESIRSAPLLVLDDLGTEAPTAWAAEKLFQLFNHRYNAQLPTVITTNQDLDSLDERLRSRLGHFGVVRPFEITALDYRGGLYQTDGSELSSLGNYGAMTFQKWDLRAGELDADLVENLGRARDVARGFAEAPAGWLVLLGEHFCGKTHLAAAIANQRVDEGDSPIFVVVPDLLDHLRATFSPTSRVRYDKRFEDIRSTRLLILDDLGTESATPWAAEKLFQLLNHRYTAGLPTVITTASHLDDIPARLRSRMLDRRSCTIFEIRAPAYRWAGPKPPPGSRAATGKAAPRSTGTTRTPTRRSGQR